MALGEGRKEVSENKSKEAGMGDGEECVCEALNGSRCGQSEPEII